MCEANAYMVKDGKEELLMESVDLIEPEDNNNSYRIMSIFGEQKIVKGRIKSMNLVAHKILFERFV
ncbi:MAG: CooT family nickel-binding protein [Desulfamplus sp.]|nr:CooT family nickel-binding protein [Desulfamplus sp.]